MAKVEIFDLSGTSLLPTANPYDAILQTCNYDPSLQDRQQADTVSLQKQIQERYQQHRIARNAQQKEKILARDFPGWVLDDHLVKLDGELQNPAFVDPRNCLVFWARPTQKLKNLIEIVQQKLRAIAPDIWLMPLSSLHMTAMEVTHSLSAQDIQVLVDKLQPACQSIADTKPTRRARIIMPMLSYDAAALALSFVPAAGENLSDSTKRTVEDDDYTYHEYRRDLYAAILDAGVPVASRYVVPSAHLTIARFNSPNVFGGGKGSQDIEAGKDIKRREKWIREIEMINKWLEGEFWPKGDGKRIKAGGEWVMGEEKGLDFRKGTLWYGGGETVYLGKGVVL